MHSIDIAGPVHVPEEGLLLGNGDLSVSIYQAADRIIWRFGKSDVWDGVIRLFPAWPRNRNAAFTTFRAEGAFLVSASLRDGRVERFRIHSEQGCPCRVASPWPTGCIVREAGNGRVAGVTMETKPDGEVRLCFETRADTTYELDSADTNTTA